VLRPQYTWRTLLNIYQEKISHINSTHIVPSRIPPCQNQRETKKIYSKNYKAIVSKSTTAANR